MKSYLLVVGMLILLCPAKAQSQNNISSPKKDLQDPIDKNWLQEAQNFITEKGFEFKKSGRSSFDFFAANQKQRIGFTFTKSGYSVSPIIFTDKNVSKNWKANFEFVKLARGRTELRLNDKWVATQTKANLQFQFPGIAIEYINNESGLRQNFIVSEKIAGDKKLELLLHVKSDLVASVNNNELILKDKNNVTQLFYKDLNVWDANQKHLNASMELRDENTIAIIVDDNLAQYPITIDPLNQTPDWVTSADGILPGLIGQLAIESAYGYSVAGLGDINGDGYDDVAVGAPTMVDLNPPGGGQLAAVGAVFVYRGSSIGLPTTPSAVLRPTTRVAGALFGYSIAGGDINGDGKNDILVGAPMDRIKITVSGNDVFGTVGKAYAFNGADLTTGTNAFLEIQLSGSTIISNVNISVNALFGFSVAVTDDLNADGKKDIIIGSPTYAGIKGIIPTLDVQSGGAFVYLTKSGNPPYTQVKLEPIKQGLLGIIDLLQTNIDGLLFGYAVDGAGDYNGDGKPDVVATAPAGVNVSSLGALLNNKLLQGSAEVYYGTGTGVNTTHGAVLTATSGGLLTNLIGSIANIANLFGASVKGVRGPSCVRNGNIIVGAPLGGAIINVLGLDLKTGTVSVFKKNTSASGYVAPDQVLASPRNSNNILQLIQANVLFGYSLDNICDINCDGFADIIVGEPVSSGVQLLNANVAGGAAYVYYGNANGLYQTSPAWTLTAYEAAFLGINTSSLIGYSVAGAGRVKGAPYNYCILVGSPSRTLDFGSGLLDLGSTLGTLFSLVAGNNGVGKAFLFDIKTCDHQPVAVNDLISTNEDTPVNGNAATNDQPSLDGGNTWSLVANPSHGTVSFSSDGTYTYTPAPNYNGSDVFTYKLCDVDGDCSTATVTVTITPVDDVPTAVNDVATTNEDTPVSGNAATNDTQSGDGGNIWSLVANPSHGTAAMNSDGTYTYTPAPNYNGSDVFTYKLCDADADCSTATVTITITPVDDVPIAVNDAVTTNEDTPITNATVAGNDTPSGDGGNIWSLVANPSNGTVSLSTNGTYTYTPSANYNGSDVFTYKLCDIDGDCSTATVTITITSVDDMPVAVNDAATTNEDTPVSGNAASNDTPSGDGGNVWTLLTNPSHGTASLSTNGTYNYSPAANYNGSDQFTYKLCDADGDCSTATVTITITPVDDAPVAVNDVATTNEDTPVSGNAASNDTPSGDGGNIWSLVANPSHGSVSLSTNGTYTYTLAANYNGSDVFTYKLCDADGDCSTATVAITITPVDDVPIAVNDAVTTNEDTPITNASVSGNDTQSGDGGNVWTLLTNPSHGTVSSFSTNGTYTYVPASNYNGSDAFTYKLCDADGDCSTATVSITITPVDDVPIAVNDAVTTNEDTPITNASVAGNDTPSGDGGNVWTLLTNPSHGTVSSFSTNGTYTYVPASNYNGSDAFTYKLCDADGDCSTATVAITITPVDDVPIAVNDAVTTNEDTPITNASVSGNDTQSGDGGNVWTLLTNPSHGTVSSFSTNGTYTYIPASNYNGSDAFTYKLCDADGDCSTATVAITITPVDDVPIAVNDQVTTNEDTPKTGSVAGNDTKSGDCENNVWSLVTNPSNGAITFSSDGTFTYTPSANYNGSDQFTYKLCDCDGDCSTATVSITVTPVNDVPIAVNDQVTTNEDTPKTGSVAGNDTKSGDCPNNVWSLVTNPSHGGITFSSDGTFTYTPSANYNGSDQFTYKLCDCDGDCSTATVSITVTPVNDVPIAVNDQVTTNEDTPKTGSVAGNDTKSGDCPNNVWSLVTNPSHGGITFSSDGTFTYTPSANYNGSDQFTYKLCDCDGDCSTATASITVTPVDDMPIARDDENSTLQNTTVPGNAASNDTPSGDGGNVWTLLTNPSHGSVIFGSDGTYSYTPAAGYSGSDAFTYKLCDADIDCSTATVRMTITSPCANDQTPPAILCPSGQTVVLGPNCSASLPNYTGLATATDNCSVTVSQSPAPGTIVTGKGSLTVVLTATDGSGNTATCSFTVTKVDQTAPTILCPPTQTLVLGVNCSASLPDYRGMATATDNCGATISQSPAPNTVVSGTGSMTVVLTATDGSGNTAACSFTVNKVDQTPPTLTCASGKTIGCNTTLTFDPPAASDNCGQPTVSEVSITSTPSGTSTIHTKTWKATDGSGNTATCSQSVTQTACTGLTGNIYPTSTTCNSYLNGAAPLPQLCYSVKQNKVSNITPGVFFYFTTITAPSSTFTVSVVQTKSCASFAYFAIQQGNQITAFNSSCGNAAGGSQTTIGQGSVTINNATIGAQYVIAVKYDSKSVQGSAYTGSAPVCQYNFESRINNVVVPNSQASINLTPNCSGGAITSQTEIQTEAQAKPEAQIGLFPNPASEYVNVVFVPAHTAKSSIEMYDISGRLVVNIYNGEVEEGRSYQKKVDTKNLSSGIYLIRFRNGEFIETKKLVIAK